MSMIVPSADQTRRRRAEAARQYGQEIADAHREIIRKGLDREAIIVLADVDDELGQMVAASARVSGWGVESTGWVLVAVRAEDFLSAYGSYVHPKVEAGIRGEKFPDGGIPLLVVSDFASTYFGNGTIRYGRTRKNKVTDRGLGRRRRRMTGRLTS